MSIVPVVPFRPQVVCHVKHTNHVDLPMTEFQQTIKETYLVQDRVFPKCLGLVKCGCLCKTDGADECQLMIGCFGVKTHCMTLNVSIKPIL